MQEPTTTRLLGWGSLAIAVLALAELIGTMTVGLAVNVERMNFPIRQGYAFLTDLEKSSIGLGLILAAVLGAIAIMRGDESEKLPKAALWLTVASGAVLGIAAILAVLARFRVAELVSTQPVDSLTRRVLVVFVIRNFGAAVFAILIALSVLFRAKPKPAIAAVTEEPEPTGLA